MRGVPSVNNPILLAGYYWALIITCLCIEFILFLNDKIFHITSNPIYENIYQITACLISLVLFIAPQKIINKLNYFLKVSKSIFVKITLVDLFLIMMGISFWLGIVMSSITASRSDIQNATVFYEYKLCDAAYRNVIRPAKGGDPQAQYLLAEMYLNGNGVTKNTVEGSTWLKKSASLGYDKAQKQLDELKKDNNLVTN